MVEIPAAFKSLLESTAVAFVATPGTTRYATSLQITRITSQQGEPPPVTP